MSETTDELLMKVARRRVNFRKSLYSYVAVNLFLWLVWWFTAGRITGFNGYPWPIWVMLGMGIGLVKQYINAYRGRSKDRVEEEYEKLKRQKDNSQS